MTALPSKASFTDGAVTEGGFKSAIDDLRDYLAGLLDDTGSVADARAKLNINASIYGFIPAGTKMVFYQASPPTGWTQDTAVNDRVLRVVSGTGGGTGGSWNNSSGLTVGGTSLSISHLPPHNHGGGNHRHTVQGNIDAGGSAVDVRLGDGTAVSGDPLTSFSGTIISTQGGGAAHAHGISSNSSWRPSHVNVVVASKD